MWSPVFFSGLLICAVGILDLLEEAKRIKQLDKKATPGLLYREKTDKEGVEGFVNLPALQDPTNLITLKRIPLRPRGAARSQRSG